VFRVGAVPLEIGNGERLDLACPAYERSADECSGDGHSLKGDYSEGVKQGTQRRMEELLLPHMPLHLDPSLLETGRQLSRSSCWLR
jgi:hypothetical protein